jgi:flavin reductase (DIM6/NTAB) family NADH-FMN oxidoreductase RutF
VYIDIEHGDKTWQQVYQLATTYVNPRPIAFISSLSANGVRNLAPFSFFNMVSANPPIMMVCPSRTRDGGKKDTQVNIEATGEFVVAIVTEAMVDAMNQASAPYPPEVDEFVMAGFTPGPARIVRPPLVLESPVNTECVLDRIVEYGDQAGAGAVIFGRMVAIHVNDAYLADDGLLDPEKLRTVGRLGRGSYSKTTDRFDLSRATVK